MTRHSGSKLEYQNSRGRGRRNASLGYIIIRSSLNTHTHTDRVTQLTPQARDQQQQQQQKARIETDS